MIRLFPWLFASLLSFRSNRGVVIGEKGILTLTPNFSLTDTVNMILFDSMWIIILFIVNIIWCDYMCWYSSDRSRFTLTFSWNNCQKMLLTFTLKLSLKEQLIKLTPTLESPLISYLNFQTSRKCIFCHISPNVSSLKKLFSISDLIDTSPRQPGSLHCFFWPTLSLDKGIILLSHCQQCWNNTANHPLLLGLRCHKQYNDMLLWNPDRLK